MPGVETQKALGVRVAAALTAVSKEAAMLEVEKKIIFKQEINDYLFSLFANKFN